MREVGKREEGTKEKGEERFFDHFAKEFKNGIDIMHINKFLQPLP